MAQDMERKWTNECLLDPEFFNQPEKLESYKNFSFDDMNKADLFRKNMELYCLD